MKTSKKQQLINLLNLAMQLDRQLTSALTLHQESIVANLYYLIAENNKAIAALKRNRK